MSRHRVVIVGGGFGGLYCAIALKRSPVDITLLDRRNFHLFACADIRYSAQYGTRRPVLTSGSVNHRAEGRTYRFQRNLVRELGKPPQEVLQ